MTTYLSEEEKNRIEAAKKLVDLLDKESDRGCCLLAVSFLDNEVKLLLENKLVGSEKQKKEIFGLNGALGTFSSRVNLSYSIGLISRQISDDINIIRKIRNDFGHNYNYLDFETDEIKNKILGLNYNFHKKDEYTSRKRFIDAVTIILSEIHEILEIHQEFKEKKDKEYLKNPALRELVKKLNDLIYNDKK
jgi:DNA-binding MltR family transcriptional regulator